MLAAKRFFVSFHCVLKNSYKSFVSFARAMLSGLASRRYISSMNFKLNVSDLSLFHHSSDALLCHDLSFARYHAALPALPRLSLREPRDTHNSLTRAPLKFLSPWIDEITFCDVSLLLMFIGVEVKSINEISRI
jgi:hypothetical protein